MIFNVVGIGSLPFFLIYIHSCYGKILNMNRTYNLEYLKHSVYWLVSFFIKRCFRYTYYISEESKEDIVYIMARSICIDKRLL